MRAASARLEGKLASEHTDSVNLLRELQLRDSLSACKPLCFNEFITPPNVSNTSSLPPRADFP